MDKDGLIKQILEGDDFSHNLIRIIKNNNMNVNEFCKRYKIPVNTFYKIISKSREDFRVSTLKKIYGALNDLEGKNERFIAIIAPRSTIDSLTTNEIKANKIVLKVRGYYVENITDLIARSFKAEKDGAEGIICGPLAANVIADYVDIPISSLTDSALDVAISNMISKLEQ